MSFGVVCEFIDDYWKRKEIKMKKKHLLEITWSVSFSFLVTGSILSEWTVEGGPALDSQHNHGLEKQFWSWQKQAMERMTFTKVVLVFFAMLICPPIWIFFSLPLDIRLNSRDQNDNFPDITLKLLCSFLPGQIKSHSSSLFAAASATCTFCSCWS